MWLELLPFLWFVCKKVTLYSLLLVIWIKSSIDPHYLFNLALRLHIYILYVYYRYAARIKQCTILPNRFNEYGRVKPTYGYVAAYKCSVNTCDIVLDITNKIYTFESIELRVWCCLPLLLDYELEICVSIDVGSR